MHDDAHTIARLKSMIFLIEEALRIADEGDTPLVGAKLSDCIDCLQRALSEIIVEPTPASEASHSIPIVSSE